MTAVAYVTRGRAEELERLIDELDHRLTTRLDDLRRELEDTRRQATATLELVTVIARRRQQEGATR